MTDHHNPLDPLDPLDDLASAYLDGQTSPDETARIERDAELLARVGRLSAVRAALHDAEVTVDPDRRDDAIRAALGVFDMAVDAPTAGLAEARVSPLAAVAARRRSRRTLELAGIAAVLALLALAVPFIDRLDSGSDNVVAGPLSDKSDDMTLNAEAGAGGGGSADATSSMRSGMTGEGPSHLGPFANLDDLAAAVRAQIDGPVPSNPPAGATAQDSEADRAASCADDSDPAGPVLYVALADLDGQPVVVQVVEGADGTRTLTVFDGEACTAIATRRL